MASFSIDPQVHTEDAEWETKKGRVFFKQLCTALALAGYPPSDVGDIQSTHCCEVLVDGVPLFVTLAGGVGPGDLWTLAVTRTRGRKHQPPVDTFDVRAFVGTLQRTLETLQGVHNISWQAG